MKKLLLVLFICITSYSFSETQLKFPIIAEYQYGNSSDSLFIYEYDNIFYFHVYSKEQPYGIYSIDLLLNKFNFLIEARRFYWCSIDCSRKS